MEQENRPKSIGGLWSRKTKANVHYFSGLIEINGQKINIVCFANKKTKENQPDYKILISEDRRPQQPQVPQEENPIFIKRIDEELSFEKIPF